eukprot:6464126-Amphidinium_carterae.1
MVPRHTSRTTESEATPTLRMTPPPPPCSIECSARQLNLPETERMSVFPHAMALALRADSGWWRSAAYNI